MAISGPSSYVPTVQEFLSHWSLVNADLGTELELNLDGLTPGSMITVSRDTLQDRLDDLEFTRQTVSDQLTDLTLKRAEMAQARASSLAVFNDFTARVRADLGHTPYARALPTAPSITESVENFAAPMKVAARLWLKINTTPPAGFTAPLVLQSTLTQAQFSTLVDSLSTLAEEMRDLEVDLRVARENRNDVQDETYPILKKYRQTVPTRFAEGDALIDSLPILTPESGRTPEAPVATGQWNATEQKGQISFAAIDDPDVKRYKLCWSPGDDYSAEDESVLDVLLPGAGTSFLTLQGLGSPGNVSLFRIVVELKNGHENGSEPVAVTRPA